MTRTMFALSLGFGGVILATQIAQSQVAPPQVAPPQPACGPHDALVAALDQHYGETRQALGLAPDAVMELFASPETGTWSLSFTSPDGTACLVASGTDFAPARTARIALDDPA